MGGVNGSLLRRLVLVEERAPRPAPVEVPQHVDVFWERVYTVAPPAVQRYLENIGAECQAALEHGAQPGWLELHHPAFDDVLEGLARAMRITSNNRLAYTQGYTIQWATARLGWAFAYERAGGTRAVLYDQDVRDQAGLLLLGWTNRECNQRWADPCAFLERWRLQERTFTEMQSPDMLAKAGLFDAELALLDAEEE